MSPHLQLLVFLHPLVSSPGQFLHHGRQLVFVHSAAVKANKPLTGSTSFTHFPIDVRKEKKGGTNRSSPVFCSLMTSKQSCQLSRHRNRTNIRLGVFWLFVMFAESQIKAPERDPEYCKNGCEMLFLGNL